MTELKPCHGTLTAEQVREAIFNGSSYASYDGAQYYANGINMQAIADELNTRAERTCHIEYPYYGDAPVINGQPRCSECKTEFAVGTFPNYCPHCGVKVVGE